MRRTVRPPTVTPRARTTVTPRARTTVTPTEVYDRYNINLLPNEMQYLILDQLELDELRKIYNLIVDPDVKRYVRELGTYEAKGILQLALEGNLEGVKWLHKNGADISTEHNHHETTHIHMSGYYSSVLYNAIRSGNIDLVEWLLDNGVDKVDNITLEFAADIGNMDIFMLLAQREDLDIRHHEVANTAMYSRHYDLVKFLIDQGADVNNPDLKGNAIESGNQDIIDFLTSRGAIF